MNSFHGCSSLLLFKRAIHSLSCDSYIINIYEFCLDRTLVFQNLYLSFLILSKLLSSICHLTTKIDMTWFFRILFDLFNFVKIILWITSMHNFSYIFLENITLKVVYWLFSSIHNTLWFHDLHKLDQRSVKPKVLSCVIHFKIFLSCERRYAFKISIKMSFPYIRAIKSEKVE